MKDNRRYSKWLYILPIGIIMLVPTFVVAFIRQGNIIDKIFFFIALLGYILIVTPIVLGHRKK